MRLAAAGAVRKETFDVHGDRIPDGLPILSVVQAPRDGTTLAAYAREHDAEIRAQLTVHGVLLFRGFEVSGVVGFHEFLQALALAPMDYIYRSSPRTAVAGNVFTATEYPPAQEILLHNENAYQRNWPLKLAFYCLTPAASGGQTTIADMRRITAAIGPERVGEFEVRGVKYIRHYREHVDIPWQTVFQTNSKAELAQICESNQIEHRWLDDSTLRTTQVCQGTARHPVTDERFFFNQAHVFHASSLGATSHAAMIELFGSQRLPRHACFGDGGEIPLTDLEAIRAAFQAESAAIEWRRGDVALLDNMRVAHGRHAFFGERRVLAALLDPSQRSRR